MPVPAGTVHLPPGAVHLPPGMVHPAMLPGAYAAGLIGGIPVASVLEALGGVSAASAAAFACLAPMGLGVGGPAAS
eukprot:9280661-Pyramimonas_sp.AAC.1